MTDTVAATVSRTVSTWEAAEIESLRWVEAARRAVEHDIRVYQVTGCGSWIASSASQPHVAHRLQVTNGVCHGCDCAGHAYGKVCQHRAAFYLMTGAFTAPAPKPKRPKRAEKAPAPAPQYVIANELKPDPCPRWWRPLYEVVDTAARERPVVERTRRSGEAWKVCSDLNAGRIIPSLPR